MKERETRLDIREFSNKFVEATKNMTPEERASLMKMFETVSDEINKKRTCCPVSSML